MSHEMFAHIVDPSLLQNGTYILILLKKKNKNYMQPTLVGQWPY